MGFLSDRFRSLTSDTRPSISHPRPTPFTPNPPPFERPNTPEWKTFGKKRGIRGWMKERSRVFWIVLVLSLLLIVGVSTTLPLFFLTHHSQSHSLQIQESATNQLQGTTSQSKMPPLQVQGTTSQAQGTVIDHSFLVDIETAEDEPTRAAVIIQKTNVDHRIDLKSSKNWIILGLATRYPE
jgi:hypothetical protein